MHVVVYTYFIPCIETISPPAVSGSENADSVLQAPLSPDPRDPDKVGGSPKPDEIPNITKVDYQKYMFKISGTKVTAAPQDGNGNLAFKYILL